MNGQGTRVVVPGVGTPLTSSGRSVAYLPPPWRMRGRALAFWFRVRDPDEIRRHVPPTVAVDKDPIVRARFWDLEHDAAGPAVGEPGERRWTSFREAVVAFPIVRDGVTGDLPVHMYADDFSYTAMGREVMGWPVRDGRIEVDAEPADGPHAGLVIGARMTREGRPVMEASITLEGVPALEESPPPPIWLAEKVIPHVDRPGALVAQLVATGPERIDRRHVWTATGSVSFGPSPSDELDRLAPREIVRVEYWSGMTLTVGWGRVVAELGEGVYDPR